MTGHGKQPPQQNSSLSECLPSVSTDLMPQAAPATQCLRCGRLFPSRNKLMRHLFSSPWSGFAPECAEARSGHQFQHQEANLSFSGPSQTDHCPSQANLSSFQPSAVTSLSRSQPSLSQGQSSHPSPPLSTSHNKAVRTQLNLSSRAAEGVVKQWELEAVLTAVLGIEQRMEERLEEFRKEMEKQVEALKETLTKGASGTTLPKETATEKTLTKRQTLTEPILPRPPSSSSSNSGTDNGIPITSQSTADLTHTAGYINDSSNDSDGHLDCRDRSTYETSPGQGRHHCGSGTNHGGYDSVRNNDGDTEELCHGSMPRAQGSGSSYENEDSGEDYSDGPDDHPTGYVEDCYDYGNEDHGGHSDYNDGYDDYNGYNDYNDCDDDYYD